MAGKPVKMPRVIARVHYTVTLLLAVLLAAFWPTVAGSNNSVADANRTALHTASQLKFGAKPAIVIFDGDGNVTALVDSAENIVGRYLYGPFGNPIGRWGSVAAANAMQFSSMPRHNPSGLILYPFRAYEPNLQRFTSPDPIGERGGINPYRFVYNNPLAFVDPDGLAPQLMSLSFDLNGGNASATYAYDKFGSDIRAAHAPLNESSLDYAEAAFAQVAQASYDPNSSGLDAAGSYLLGVGFTILGVLEVIPDGGLLSQPCKIAAKKAAGKAARKAAERGGLGNPFKGKTASEIDKMFKARGFEPRGNAV